MSGSFTVASHTADTAIEVQADSLAELFEWAARGMCRLMYDADSLSGDRAHVIEVEAASVDELLVDVLAEVLWWSEATDVIPVSIEVDHVSNAAASVRVGGAAQDPDRLIGPPIKAVTYHELAVVQTPAGWKAHVVFDV